MCMHVCVFQCNNYGLCFATVFTRFHQNSDGRVHHTQCVIVPATVSRDGENTCVCDVRTSQVCLWYALSCVFATLPTLHAHSDFFQSCSRPFRRY